MTEFLELAARGRNSWWRYLLTAPAAIILWAITIAVIFAGMLVTRHDPTGLASQLTAPTHIQVFFGGTAVLFGLLLVAFALCIRLLHHKRFGDITGAWDWRLTFRGAAVWLAVCILAALVDYLIEPGGFHVSVSATTLTLVIWAAPCLAIQTFTEEFIFRGYVTQGLCLATQRPLVAALISGLLFAVLHIPNGWPVAASAAAFGLVTSLIAIRTGGISFTYGMHLVNNTFGALVVVSANDVFKGSPALITQATPNLMWFDAIVPFLAMFAALWVAGVRPAWLTAKVSPRPS